MEGRYKPEEIEFLKKYANIYGIEYCAKELNRSVKGVKSKCVRLNIEFSKTNNTNTIDIPKFKSNFKELNLDFSTQINCKELAYFLGYF